MKLMPAEVADLYRKCMSPCEIAAAYGITRGGAEARIRAGGLGGVQYCPVHRVHEELRQANSEAMSYMAARWGAVEAPELGRPALQTEWPDNPPGVCPCHDSAADHDADGAAGAGMQSVVIHHRIFMAGMDEPECVHAEPPCDCDPNPSRYPLARSQDRSHMRQEQ